MTPDPYAPLLAIVERYRRDVHLLADPAGPEAVQLAAQHLGQALPPSHAEFLRRWNGAHLFRGALRVRAVSELALVQAASNAVAFADGPGSTVWAWTPDGQGGHGFGRVTRGDGQVLVDPVHEHFHAWLIASVAVLDGDALDAQGELAARAAADPASPHLLRAQGDVALARGEVDLAVVRYRSALTADPQLARAWQRLGEAMLGADSGEARFALVRALRATRLPLPGLLHHAPDPSVFGQLDALFPAGDPGWEDELRRFLDDRVADVRSELGLRLYTEAAVARGRLLVGRGHRSAARDALTHALQRAAGFSRRGLLEPLRLLLARVHEGLGEYDDAERVIRPLRDHDDTGWRARFALEVGRVAVARREPWAEEILEEALEGLDDDAELAEAWLLLGERHLSAERLDRAAQAFTQADTAAVRAHDRRLQAAVCLGQGDLAWARQARAEAERLWESAGLRAREANDAEARLRVRVRRGDILAAAGRPQEAADDYRRAAQGYGEHQLPVREAWVRLRLARLGGASEDLRLAREWFMRSDLPVGVASVDALEGRASLDWHLERSSNHARERYEAARARPPHSRADADRPERRMGAHRLAIAASGVDVVRALADELARCSRSLEGARARPTDPAVTRFIAAADLLAFHRSLDAAEVLLSHLASGAQAEPARNGLRGVLARSPNAALVDGLLSTVEHGAEPRAVAAAADVLGWRRERSAVAPLVRLVESQRSPTVRRAAVVALGRIGDRSAVPALSGLLDDDGLEVELAVALLLLGDRRGVDFHGQVLAQGRELDSGPGEVVGRYGGPDYLLLLRATADGEGPKALGALQGLGYLGDPRAVPTLLRNLSHRDAPRISVAAGALELLTGHHEDPDQPGLHLRWEAWWEREEAAFEAGHRYRHGRLLSLDALVGQLGDDDAFVRRGAYDELVISTGVNLPFDGDGPWRVQLAHRRGWRAWCREHRDQFPDGRWWFDGTVVG